MTAFQVEGTARAEALGQEHEEEASVVKTEGGGEGGDDAAAIASL